MLTGKNVSLNMQIGELFETVSGASSPKDFETMLQLLYLQFEEPRFDQEAYDALKSRYLTMVTNLAKNPQKAMSDSLQMILTGHSPRTKLVVPELFDEISLAQMEEIHRDRFTDAGDFTWFIVGNLDEATVKPWSRNTSAPSPTNPAPKNGPTTRWDSPKAKPSGKSPSPWKPKKPRWWSPLTNL